MIDEITDIPGVIFLSSIPNGITVAHLQTIMSEFGEIGRVYLVPSKKQFSKKMYNYEEGWVEFKKEKDAKHVAKYLNGNVLPNSKKMPWEGVICNIRFLPNFNWSDIYKEEATKNVKSGTKRLRDIIKSKKEGREVKGMINYSKFMQKRKHNEETGASILTHDLNGSETIPKPKKSKMKHKTNPVCNVVQNPDIARNLFAI